MMKSGKRDIIIGSILVFLCLSGMVRGEETKVRKAKEPVWYTDSWKPILGVRIGTDIGGALPFPFKYIPSEFAPKLKLKLTFGGEVIVPIDKHWSVAAEVNYKGVAIDADAFVEDQRFMMDGSQTYFTGMAVMSMSFTMLEIPLYAKYAFSGGRNRVMLGGYYAIGKGQSFDVIAKKGFMRGSLESEDLDVLTEDYLMSFNDQLDTWDAGVVFGYERYILDNLAVNGKVHIGFKSIFTKGFDMLDYKMYQMRLAVGLSYELVDFSKKYHLKKYIPSFRRKNKNTDL